MCYIKLYLDYIALIYLDAHPRQMFKGPIYRTPLELEDKVH